MRKLCHTRAWNPTPRVSNNAVSSIWKVRASSRLWLLHGFTACALCVLSTDSAAVVPKLYLTLLVTFTMILKSYFRGKTSEACEQNFFAIAMATFTSATLVYFICAALGYFPEGIFIGNRDSDKLFSFNNLSRMMASRMKSGQFPCPMVAISLILPTLGTTAGMDVTAAKISSSVNVALHICLIFAMHSRFPQNDENAYTAARANLVHDVILTTGLSIMCFTACAPGVAAANEVIRLLNASVLADTIMNHVLKNSIIEIATLAELDKQEKSSGRQDQVLTQLYRTMRWCASRQVLVELASGTYRTNLSPVNVQNLVRGTVEDKDHVDVSIVDETIGIGTVHVDETMAWVVLENAMNNALEHGDGKVSLLVRYNSNTNSIEFTIENKVQEGEYKRDRSMSLTDDPDEPDSILRSKRPPSTHCGMRHVALACQGAGGTSRLEFSSDEMGERIAVFTASMPAIVTPSCLEEASLNLGNEPVMNLPRMLKICALDDSSIICKGIRQILFKALEADYETSVVCCPRNASDVTTFMDQIFSPPPSAEIVLLDQNIDLGDVGAPRMLGTNLADELRLRGYEGLLVIRSANTTVSDDNEYLRSGSVDVCIGKHETQKNAVELIVKAYISKNKINDD